MDSLLETLQAISKSIKGSEKPHVVITISAEDIFINDLEEKVRVVEFMEFVKHLPEIQDMLKNYKFDICHPEDN